MDETQTTASQLVKEGQDLWSPGASAGSSWSELGLIEKVFEHSPYLPFDPAVGMYNTSMGPIQPWHFTDWQDESMSWKKGCYLHAGLNPTTTYRISGPQALDFISANIVNSTARFAVGAGKHAIMCNDDGLILEHGVLLRTGEEDFVTYWLAPTISSRFEEGGYDAVGEDLTGRVYMFQIAGPRSLEALEAATGEDLHDIRFMRHRRSQVEGHEVTVLRMGMGGTLSYELHGPIEDAKAVYAAVLKAGEAFGMRRLGWGSYMLNHTENGYPQIGWHFLAAPQDATVPYADSIEGIKPLGSLGPDVRKRYCTPVDLGWGKSIVFDHEFRGRAALEKQVANPPRTAVTLIWNAEDVNDVHASLLRPGEPYEFMEMPHPLKMYFGFAEGFVNMADEVLKDGKPVGFSSGRVYSYYSHEMLSLGVVDVACAAPGTELTILWGQPGSRQKEIRAVAAPVPHLDLTPNKDFDVEAIPHPGGKG